MRKTKVLIIILVLVVVTGAIYYFTSVYKSPAQMQAEKVAIQAALQEKQAGLVAIEDYFLMRQQPDAPQDQIVVLQDAIIKAGDGLITASKDDLEAFDRGAGALKTLLSMEIEELTEAAAK